MEMEFRQQLFSFYLKICYHKYIHYVLKKKFVINEHR